MKIEAQISEIALDDVVDEVYSEDRDEFRSITLREMIADRLTAAITDSPQWTAMIGRAIKDNRERIEALVIDAVVESLRQMVLTEAGRQLHQVTSASMRRGQDSTAVQSMIATAVSEAMRAQISDIVDQVRAEFPGEVAALIQEALRSR